MDRFNNKYKLKFKDDLTYIIDYKKHILNDYRTYYQMGINCLRLEFTGNKEDYENIINQV